MEFRFILVILSLIFICGCVSGPVCNKPYIVVGNDCCLDINDNSICDVDETTTITTISTTTTIKQPTTTILKKKPTTTILTPTTAILAEFITRYSAKELILTEKEIQDIFGSDWKKEEHSCPDKTGKTACKSFAGDYITLVSTPHYLKGRKPIGIHVVIFDSEPLARERYLEYYYVHYRGIHKPIDVGKAGIVSHKGCVFYSGNVFVHIYTSEGYTGFHLDENVRDYKSLLPNYELEIVKTCRAQWQRIEDFLVLSS